MMDQNGDVENDIKEDETSSDIDLTEFDENKAVVLWSQPQSTDEKMLLHQMYQEIFFQDTSTSQVFITATLQKRFMRIDLTTPQPTFIKPSPAIYW